MKKLLFLFLAFSFASCKLPTVTLVDGVPMGEKPLVEAPEKPAVVPETPKSPSPPPIADDGFRLGDDILELPKDEELSRSSDSSSEDGATIITRPPEE